MTTTSVAYSRVPSMPSNASAESAAVAAGPVTWTLRPSLPAAAMSRISSTDDAELLPAARAGV